MPDSVTAFACILCSFVRLFFFPTISNFNHLVVSVPGH